MASSSSASIRRDNTYCSATVFVKVPPGAPADSILTFRVQPGARPRAVSVPARVTEGESLIVEIPMRPGDAEPVVHQITKVATPPPRTEEALLHGFPCVSPRVGVGLSSWPVIVFRAPMPSPDDDLEELPLWKWSIVAIDDVPMPGALEVCGTGCTYEEFLLQNNVLVDHIDGFPTRTHLLRVMHKQTRSVCARAGLESPH